MPAAATTTVGAVLCGGASRRMGRDKALIERDGRALAVRVADALRAGGCTRVVAVGGTAPALRALGLDPVPDRWPGSGPLAGLATALAAASPGDRLVLGPCDLLAPSADAVRRLLAALDGDPAADVAVPHLAGRDEWIHSAWRVRPALVTAIADAAEGGARRLDTVAGLARAVTVIDVDPRALRDADSPADL